MSRTYTADDWDFYECEIDHCPVSITVNLSAILRAPAHDKPWLLQLSARVVTVKSATSHAEQPFSELQAPVAVDVSQPLRCEFIGSITSSAATEFYFYSTSTQGFEGIYNKVRRLFPQCSIECKSEHDPEWKQYRELLYPAAIEMLQIRNRRVLRRLETRGDHHAVCRPVDHDFYFRTASTRAEFIGAAGEIGFREQFAPRWPVPGRVERPYIVNLIRSDPVTADHIGGVALELLLLAARFDGEYDGWGCDVCTSES